MTTDATVVLDIGKTNGKLTLLDTEGRILAVARRPNTVLNGGPYPHLDTEGLWAWMLAQMREFSAIARVGAVVPVTHGATAALVDTRGLVLPVLDYEFVPRAAGDPADQPYQQERPAFAETSSPALPAGLNLGRQLAWLASSFPAEFARARHVLMYPQYWAWRLCGVAASEVTSLGCHTDLWSAEGQRYSSLIERMGWGSLLPPRRDAWASLGTLLPEVAEASGLPADCQVICGIHDSNASLLRHLGQPATVLSTGTWLIAAEVGGTAKPVLDEALDMLANVDVFGRPVPCMRFMGGREFAALAGAAPEPCDVADLARLVAQGTFAMPCFADSGGPFAGRVGRVEGPAPRTAAEKYALATLYCVLMTDFCLDALGSINPVIVEGSFTANPFFGPLLAALRPTQPVAVSDDSSGTTCGGWMLHRWGRQGEQGGVTAVEPLHLPGWQNYRDQWRRN